MHRRILAALAALACATPALAQDPGTAMATFMDAEGAEVGSVILTQGTDSVTLVGNLIGQTPGEHGFHFHETGDCDGAGGFESAGGHFNPTDRLHGIENPDGPHAGDLPNVTAADDGTVEIDYTTAMVSLNPDHPGYVFDADGTSLVFHAGPDDNMTDPAGNSGDRIACAVIEANTAP